MPFLFLEGNKTYYVNNKRKQKPISLRPLSSWTVRKKKHIIRNSQRVSHHPWP